MNEELLNADEQGFLSGDSLDLKRKRPTAFERAQAAVAAKRQTATPSHQIPKFLKGYATRVPRNRKAPDVPCWIPEIPPAPTIEEPDWDELDRIEQTNRRLLVQEIAAALREQSPHAAPAMVEESQGKPRAFTQERAAHLAAVLDEIEARAVEANHPFNRAQWPGTKAEFMAFLRWKDASLTYILPTDDGRLSDVLRPLGVKFGRPGRDKTKGLRFYRALFPDYPA